MNLTAYNNTAGCTGAGYAARVVRRINARDDEPGLPLHLLRS
ncbi:hypothetical protein [Candidatus Oscillochloris fontis]|nr:hypothetical protein [Candidatus Oscillochloris fontis]